MTSWTTTPLAAPELGLARTDQLLRHSARVARLSVLEARPTVLAVFLLRFLAAAALAGRVELGAHLIRTLGCALVWGAAVCFVYLLNGTTDVVEDRVNGSRRPIAQDRLAVDDAHRMLAVLAIGALAGGMLYGRAVAAMVMALLVLGYLYSGAGISLKRWQWASSGIVSAAGLLTYAAGWVVSTGSAPSPQVLVLAVVMSLWMGLVGAVAKDFSDIDGDVVAGRRCARTGAADAQRRIRCSASALLLGFGTLAIGYEWLPQLQLPGLVLLIGAVAVAVTCARTRHSVQRSQRRAPYRCFMLAQYGANLAVITGILELLAG